MSIGTTRRLQFEITHSKHVDLVDHYQMQDTKNDIPNSFAITTCGVGEDSIRCSG